MRQKAHNEIFSVVFVIFRSGRVVLFFLEMIFFSKVDPKMLLRETEKFALNDDEEGEATCVHQISSRCKLLRLVSRPHSGQRPATKVQLESFFSSCF